MEEKLVFKENWLSKIFLTKVSAQTKTKHIVETLEMSHFPVRALNVVPKELKSILD